jgi:glycosyltransferase involved in cell wall biosynthesis
MRILHTVQELGMGGAERIVVALARDSERAGFEVGVAAAPGPLTADVRRWFPLPIVGRRSSRIPAAAVALERAVRQLKPGLIHCHNPTMAVVAALVTARGRRIPGLVSVHGVPDEDYDRAGRVLRFAGLPVVACGPTVEGALRATGVRVRETIVNGVGPPPIPARRESLLTELELPLSQPLVITVGRLVPQKNHTLALRALAELPDATLVIVGDGPLRDDLERQARREGVEGRVAFTGVRPDARALIGAADAVLLPSRWEGLPLVALETLAVGTPLVATDVRGLRELLSDGDNALLVPPDDPGAMAAALRRVLTDSGLQAKLREGALRTANRYSERAMTDAYLRLYRELAP